MRYLVNHNYKSSIGQYEEGLVVDLDEAQADWVNRDSPGTLSPVYTPDVEPETVDDAPVEDDGLTPADETETPADADAEGEGEPVEPETVDDAPKTKRGRKAT